MFTGIIEQIGLITQLSPRPSGICMKIQCEWTDLALGESIAVSGVCLTVVSFERFNSSQNIFEVDVSSETLSRSVLSTWQTGCRVNLERALRADTRLGGHIVSGHVDATTELVHRETCGEAVKMRFFLPPSLGRLVAEKGSIAIDGVSLTVNQVDDSTSSFELMLIPFTLTHTTLGMLQVGARVNLEVDMLARYVARHFSLNSSTK